MTLFQWWILLVLQNAAFTWVSRARNSGSLLYHGFAAVLYLIGMVARHDMEIPHLILLGTVYISATVTGSVLMHWVSMTYLEKGKRKVGSTKETK
jgi:hypothetical protein